MQGQSPNEGLRENMHMLFVSGYLVQKKVFYARTLILQTIPTARSI